MFELELNYSLLVNVVNLCWKTEIFSRAYSMHMHAIAVQRFVFIEIVQIKCSIHEHDEIRYFMLRC